MRRMKNWLGLVCFLVGFFFLELLSVSVYSAEISFDSSYLVRSQYHLDPCHVDTPMSGSMRASVYSPSGDALVSRCSYNYFESEPMSDYDMERDSCGHNLHVPNTYVSYGKIESGSTVFVAGQSLSNPFYMSGSITNRIDFLDRVLDDEDPPGTRIHYSSTGGIRSRINSSHLDGELSFDSTVSSSDSILTKSLSENTCAARDIKGIAVYPVDIRGYVSTSGVNPFSYSGGYAYSNGFSDSAFSGAASDDGVGSYVARKIYPIGLVSYTCPDPSDREGPVEIVAPCGNPLVYYDFDGSSRTAESSSWSQAGQSFESGSDDSGASICIQGSSAWAESESGLGDNGRRIVQRTVFPVNCPDEIWSACERGGLDPNQPYDDSLTNIEWTLLFLDSLDERGCDYNLITMSPVFSPYQYSCPETYANWLITDIAFWALQVPISWVDPRCSVPARNNHKYYCKLDVSPKSVEGDGSGSDFDFSARVYKLIRSGTGRSFVKLSGQKFYWTFSDGNSQTTGPGGDTLRHSFIGLGPHWGAVEVEVGDGADTYRVSCSNDCSVVPINKPRAFCSGSPARQILGDDRLDSGWVTWSAIASDGDTSCGRYTYFWSFDPKVGGTPYYSDAGDSVDVYYSTIGEKKATVTATDCSGHSVIADCKVYIDPISVVCYPNEKAVLVNQQVTWIALDSDLSSRQGYPRSYLWFFDGGFGGAGNPIQKSYSTPGKHTASVKVSLDGYTVDANCHPVEVYLDDTEPYCSLSAMPYTVNSKTNNSLLQVFFNYLDSPIKEVRSVSCGGGASTNSTFQCIGQDSLGSCDFMCSNYSSDAIATIVLATNSDKELSCSTSINYEDDENEPNCAISPYYVRVPDGNSVEFTINFDNFNDGFFLSSSTVCGDSANLDMGTCNDGLRGDSSCKFTCKNYGSNGGNSTFNINSFGKNGLSGSNIYCGKSIVELTDINPTCEINPRESTISKGGSFSGSVIVNNASSQVNTDSVEINCGNGTLINPTLCNNGVCSFSCKSYDNDATIRATVSASGKTASCDANVIVSNTPRVDYECEMEPSSFDVRAGDKVPFKIKVYSVYQGIKTPLDESIIQVTKFIDLNDGLGFGVFSESKSYTYNTVGSYTATSRIIDPNNNNFVIDCTGAVVRVTHNCTGTCIPGECSSDFFRVPFGVCAQGEVCCEHIPTCMDPGACYDGNSCSLGYSGFNGSCDAGKVCCIKVGGSNFVKIDLFTDKALYSRDENIIAQIVVTKLLESNLADPKIKVGVLNSANEYTLICDDSSNYSNCGILTWGSKNSVETNILYSSSILENGSYNFVAEILNNYSGEAILSDNIAKLAVTVNESKEVNIPDNDLWIVVLLVTLVAFILAGTKKYSKTNKK